MKTIAKFTIAACLLLGGCATATRGIIANLPGGYQVTEQFAADHPAVNYEPQPGCFYISDAEMHRALGLR